MLTTCLCFYTLSLFYSVSVFLSTALLSFYLSCFRDVEAPYSELAIRKGKESRGAESVNSQSVSQRSERDRLHSGKFLIFLIFFSSFRSQLVGFLLFQFGFEITGGSVSRLCLVWIRLFSFLGQKRGGIEPTQWLPHLLFCLFGMSNPSCLLTCRFYL